MYQYIQKANKERLENNEHEEAPAHQTRSSPNVEDPILIEFSEPTDDQTDDEEEDL